MLHRFLVWMDAHPLEVAAVCLAIAVALMLADAIHRRIQRKREVARELEEMTRQRQILHFQPQREGNHSDMEMYL